MDSMLIDIYRRAERRRVERRCKRRREERTNKIKRDTHNGDLSSCATLGVQNGINPLLPLSGPLLKRMIDDFAAAYALVVIVVFVDDIASSHLLCLSVAVEE